MQTLRLERKKAIDLRKKGFSYGEILKRVPVSQSSLSNWLKDIKLTEKQKLRLRKKITNGQLKGARQRKKKKDLEQNLMRKIVTLHLKDINKRELFMLGLGLYWGEGSKQSSLSPTERLMFTNSDHEMVKVFLSWLENCLNVKISPETIRLTLYLHKGAPESTIKKFWEDCLGVGEEYFNKSVVKNIPFDKDRYNHYRGVIRITMKKSTNINRLISEYIKRAFVLIMRDGVRVARLPLKQKI